MLKTIALLLVVALFSLGGTMMFTLHSPAFNEGENVPVHYTCDGDDQSPPLHWEHAPSNTQSFALIISDPDAPAGVWDHWVLYNIPATTQSLPENLRILPLGTQTGENSWKHAYYNGPCPPSHEQHRYIFKLYALDTVLELKDGASTAELETAMQGHILATAELMGRYERVEK